MKHSLIILIAFFACLPIHAGGGTEVRELATLSETELMEIKYELDEKDQKLERILKIYQRHSSREIDFKTSWRRQITLLDQYESTHICEEGYCSLKAAVTGQAYTVNDGIEPLDLISITKVELHNKERQLCAVLRQQLKLIDTEIQVIEHVITKYLEIFMTIISAVKTINETLISSAGNATDQIIETKEGSITPLQELTKNLTRICVGIEAGTLTLVPLPLHSLQIIVKDLHKSIGRICTASEYVKKEGANLMYRMGDPYPKSELAKQFFSQIYDCYTGDELMSCMTRRKK